MSNPEKTRTNAIMLAIFIATFMTSVETTIVTTALPTIINKLHGLSLQSWVFAMYLLTTAISTPIYGKLSDRIGRKPIFLIGLILFSFGSFLCGLAPNMLFLISARALQGLGAGAIMPVTFTIIADLFAYKKRASMIALNNTAWGISALLGPIVGGIIVDQLNWHWIFFINVPLGIIVFLLVLSQLQEQQKSVKKLPIDFAGICSLSILLVAILIFFQTLGASRIAILTVILTIVIMLAAFFWFAYAEKNADDPLIPLSLFKNSLFLIQIVTALLLSGVQIGFQTYFPMWLQAIYRASASLAGLAVTPSPVLWLMTSFFVGRLVSRFSPKHITLPIVLAMTVTYLPLVVANQSFPQFAFYVIAGITGAALGVIITMNTLVSQRVVPAEMIGTASSMLTLGRTLGQTIMTGIFGLVFNLSINQALTKTSAISLRQVNDFMSTTSQFTNPQLTTLLKHIVISGMNKVFLVAVAVLILVLLINGMDQNKQVIN